MKPGRTGIKRLFYATGYSIQGLKAAWLNEAAIRQETVTSILLITITFVLPVTKIEQIMMIGCLVLVVIVELMNSAVEAVVDRVGSEWHELSGRAKDIGSAAVLIALIFSAFTWMFILWPYYF
ncbi:diacylglycerol kinase [Vibrio anguillarum]|uniref:Diacylglycerol kinase n=1 Tax=Vibrio anguillarum TaxID=55601 RepID=A0AAW4B0B0_VIBAN|nr:MULTISPECIES: diacylglycerol kinase [Vibrio]AEH33314.1 Diacylglycerol kinase [Vibrio anguillarum 775]AGU57789.1 diacylglycerol kinase [Vibrio anguillarum M3]ARV26457.1 prokaryotic diacylglycerol kinase family protein [Vibrio anguillarum]ASF91744.1 diacylglycerol kinase [Vibrio anguillarum]ATA49595.1 diacylglycerol kinase [Vibrio anguillarum]